MTTQTEQPDDPTVGVDLTDMEWRGLVRAYITRTFLPESVQVFDDAISEGFTSGEAAYNAVRNEAVNAALSETMLSQLQQPVSVTTNDEMSGEIAPAPVQRVWVTFQKEGIHAYPAAATDPTLKTGDWDDVSFLASPHRHIFHFRVTMQVFHDDRDVEFIQLKRWCERLYEAGTLELNSKSCEMLSNDLYAELIARWPGRWIEIEVSEDGENGSKTTYPV